MRDLALTLVLLLGLPVALRRPFIGVLVFAWLGLMNPHRLTWGYAQAIPWSLLYAIATLLGLLLQREGAVLASLRQYWLPLAYTFWMLVTTTVAMRPLHAWTRFDGIWKVQLMCLCTLILLTSRRRIEVFGVVAILSIIFYGIKGGYFTILTAGNFRVWGPQGTVIEDNNQLAAGLVIAFPLLYWIYSLAKNSWQKIFLLGAAFLTIFSILGSHSRGGFLAVGAMAIFLWIKSDRKFVFLTLLGPLMLAALTFMPDHYWERVHSIRNYHEDSSALGRLNTWATAFRIANDRLTGAGLEYYSQEVFLRYAPDPTKVNASHSIYFQALGEHGWIGLLLFISIVFQFWRTCGRLRRSAISSHGAEHYAIYGRMAQVSIVGFAVGGAFVNIGNWDFIYYLFVLALAMERSLMQSLAATAPSHARTKVVPKSPSGTHTP